MVVARNPNTDPSTLAMCTSGYPRLVRADGTLVPLTGLESDTYLHVSLRTGKATRALINYPSGTYAGLAIELSDKCRIGESLVVSNSKGMFASNAKMTLMFKGTIVISGINGSFSSFITDTPVRMDLNPMLRALAEVNDPTEIPAAVDGAENTVKSE